MCGSCNDPFHDLSDDLDDADVFSGELSQADRDAGMRMAEAEAARIYTERCPNCSGTGRYRSYGACFKCKGTGKLSFKTSAVQRNTARVARENKADQARIDMQAKRQAWIDANPDDFAWMNAKQETFEFARSMYDAFIKWGALTEKQHATVTRLRIADADRLAAFKAADAARLASAPAVNVDRISEAFAHAQGKGIKKPRMTLDGFKISLAPLTGRNAGALYVVRKADDQYLGKIMDGRFTRVRECDDATETHVVRIIADPKGEAIAYGQRTGQCCICGRELTNHASIDAGIGPICAEKYGWA